MAKQNDFYLTKEGLSELESELKDLKDNKRKEVATALKEAKEFGDLSENTDWDDAKARQLFIEGRISEIENVIKHAKIIEGAATDSVSIGSTVEVELENDKHTFKIVGSTEANPPALPEFLRRDARWLAGNLQYRHLLRMKGFAPMGRWQLAQAILLFAGASLYTAMLLLAAVMAAAVRRRVLSFIGLSSGSCRTGGRRRPPDDGRRQIGRAHV